MRTTMYIPGAIRLRDNGGVRLLPCRSAPHERLT